MQKLILAAPVAQKLQREIGDDFIGVHVGRGAGPALHRIDHELVEVAPVLGDEIAGAVDRVGLLRRQLLEPPVGARRRLLDEGKGADELGKMPDRNAGDRKIFDRAQRVDAPIGIRRNLRLAEKIVLAPCRDAVEVDRAGHGERQRGRLCPLAPGKRRWSGSEIVFCHDGQTGFKSGEVARDDVPTLLRRPVCRCMALVPYIWWRGAKIDRDWQIEHKLHPLKLKFMNEVEGASSCKALEDG